MVKDDILKNVYDYCVKHMNIRGLCSAVDTGEYIVFSVGNLDVVDYGGCLISVDKKDGTIEAIGVIENIELIVKSKKLDIPEEYKC